MTGTSTRIVRVRRNAETELSPASLAERMAPPICARTCPSGAATSALTSPGTWATGRRLSKISEASPVATALAEAAATTLAVTKRPSRLSAR